MLKYLIAGALIMWTVLSVVQIIGYKKNLGKNFTFIALTSLPVTGVYFLIMLILAPVLWTINAGYTLVYHLFDPISEARLEYLKRVVGLKGNSVRFLFKNIWFINWGKSAPIYRRFALFKVKK